MARLRPLALSVLTLASTVSVAAASASPSAGLASAWLGVRAGALRVGQERLATYAFVELELPLGALLVRAASARPRPSSAPPLGPLARATVRAALRAAGLATDRRLDALGGRARWSASLPELQLRGGRTTDQSLRLAPTTTDPYRFTQTGATSLVYEGRLRWRLDRLVFAGEELRLEQLRHARAQARARVTQRTLELLFAWQRARLAAEEAGLEPAEQALRELALEQAEAALDVATGGWFSRNNARLR